VIRIHKPEQAPDKLTLDGKKKRRSHCISYSRNPSVYQTGAKKFEFDQSIYADASVKQALIAAQHGKCCFCERLIGTDGDVEHFRPKQAYKQAAGHSLQRPGYYWLAYEWDNLYLACSGCNQRHKQNLFPLQNPANRATNHNQTVQQEQPLFIDPGKEDPEILISFRREIAYAINDNFRAKETIDALKLNQRSLPETRLQRLQLLKRLHQLIKLANGQPSNADLQRLGVEAKSTLEEAEQDQAEFAAAARCAIRSEFRYVP
jgi:uncharacterized protein (TIGR02646 family)